MNILTSCPRYFRSLNWLSLSFPVKHSLASVVIAIATAHWNYKLLFNKEDLMLTWTKRKVNFHCIYLHLLWESFDGKHAPHTEKLTGAYDLVAAVFDILRWYHHWLLIEASLKSMRKTFQLQWWIRKRRRLGIQLSNSENKTDRTGGCLC